MQHIYQGLPCLHAMFGSDLGEDTVIPQRRLQESISPKIAPLCSILREYGRTRPLSKKPGFWHDCCF